VRLGVFTYGMNNRWTGIGRYAAELTRTLRRCDPTLDIVLLNPYPDSPHPWYCEFESYPLPQLRLLPATASLGNWTLHRAATELKLDILHDPCGVAPFLTPTRRYKRITTVHDAIPFIYPRSQPLGTRFVFHTLVKAARVTADAVLTVSEAAARDLTTYAGIPEKKLFVTPNGDPRHLLYPRRTWQPSLPSWVSAHPICSTWARCTPAKTSSV
jgi:glycosyltransferase involved in cell wall biosynthesis